MAVRVAVAVAGRVATTRCWQPVSLVACLEQQRPLRKLAPRHVQVVAKTVHELGLGARQQTQRNASHACPRAVGVRSVNQQLSQHKSTFIATISAPTSRRNSLWGTLAIRGFRVRRRRISRNATSTTELGSCASPSSCTVNKTNLSLACW